VKGQSRLVIAGSPRKLF